MIDKILVGGTIVFLVCTIAAVVIKTSAWVVW